MGIDGAKSGHVAQAAIGSTNKATKTDNNNNRAEVTEAGLGEIRDAVNVKPNTASTNVANAAHSFAIAA